MKPMLIAVILTIIFLVPTFAHRGMQEPDEIIKNIMLQQGVADEKQIDCAKISQDETEFLGDAVMEKMIGGHELHEQMDEMMGGEGSASLRQMHIAMGKNWLGCGVNQGVASGMGSTMAPMMMRMMGSYYPAYYSSFDATLIFGVIGWILFIAALVYLFLVRQKKHKR